MRIVFLSFFLPKFFSFQFFDSVLALFGSLDGEVVVLIFISSTVVSWETDVPKTPAPIGGSESV